METQLLFGYCGKVCSTALIMEEVCSTNFSITKCPSLLISYMFEWPGYYLLYIGMIAPCGPKIAKVLILLAWILIVTIWPAFIYVVFQSLRHVSGVVLGPFFNS